MAVAISWANYFNTLLERIGHPSCRDWLTIDYRTAQHKMPEVARAGAAPLRHARSSSTSSPSRIVAVITRRPRLGRFASRRASTSGMVGDQARRARLLRDRELQLRASPSNWHPFAPNGFSGRRHRAAAIIFFAYIGFDAVSTTAEECREPEARHADRHHRVADRLHRRSTSSSPPSSRA